MLLCAAAGWAVSIVFVRAHRFQASALSLAPWQTLTAALLLLPCAIGVEGARPSLSLRAVASLAYVGPVATAFAYWAVVEVGRYLRATTVAVTLLAVPSVGLIISALTFHETVSASLILGVAMVSAGVLLTTIRWRSTPSCVCCPPCDRRPNDIERRSLKLSMLLTRR